MFNNSSKTRLPPEGSKLSESSQESSFSGNSQLSSKGMGSRLHRKGPSSDTFNWKANLLSPVIGSFCANLLQQPFDLVKMKMQSDPARYPWILSTVKEIVKHDGVLGLYRGSMINFFGGAAYQAYRWSLYKTHKHKNETTHQQYHPLVRILYTSTMLSLTLCFATAPIEHSKVRLNLYKGSRELNSQWASMKNIFNKHGVTGLYRGFTLSLARDFFYYMMFLSVFEYIQTNLRQKGYRSEVVNLASVVSGICGWLVAFPLDTIKTAMQSQSLSKPETTAWAFFRDTVKSGKIHKLYWGLTSCLIRIPPVSFIFFSSWEYSLNLLEKMEGF